MNSELSPNRPLILILLAILFLIALSYIPGGIKILGYETKPVDLFIDIKPDSLLGMNNFSPVKDNSEFKILLSSDFHVSSSFIDDKQKQNSIEKPSGKARE